MLQVNDKFITLQQVLRPLRRQLQAAAAASSEEVFRRRALELIGEEIRTQIERTVLLGEAEKQISEEEEPIIREEVNNRLRQTIAEVGSRALFDQQLRREGTDLSAWQEDVRRALMVNLYLHRRFGASIEITRRKMWEYYKAHRDEFRTEGGAQMQIIAAPFRKFLPADRPATDADRQAARRDAREQIGKAAAALAKGEDFGQAARTFSKGPMASSGGVWPMMERGSFRAKPVEDAAFAQKVGQVSKVIETPLGFHVVKTIARRPAREPTFESVQADIEEKLKQQEYDKLREKYLKDIRTKTRISWAERFERLAADAAVRMFYPRR